jgi:IclR family acetate operon transcriptional repressor
MEICEKSGLSRSTAHRLLIALSEAGYIERNERTKTYSLGLPIVRIAAGLLNRISIRSIARPYLEQLTKETQETSHLAQVDSFQALYIDLVDSPLEIGFLTTRIGKHLPLHCSASGKALLAFKSAEFREAFFKRAELTQRTENTLTTREALEANLEETRKRGYSLDIMESNSGNKSIGAPIFGRNGDVIAAISVAGPAFRFEPQTEAVVGSLLKAAAHINELVKDLID